jgi:hypothetical protein
MLTETVYSAHFYFEELEQTPNPSVIERLNKQIKLENLVAPSKYEDMHSALSVFDCKGTISLRNIQSKYSMKILWGQ